MSFCVYFVFFFENSFKRSVSLDFITHQKQNTEKLKNTENTQKIGELIKNIPATIQRG